MVDVLIHFLFQEKRCAPPVCFYSGRCYWLSLQARRTALRLPVLSKVDVWRSFIAPNVILSIKSAQARFELLRHFALCTNAIPWRCLRKRSARGYRPVIPACRNSSSNPTRSATSSSSLNPSSDLHRKLAFMCKLASICREQHELYQCAPDHFRP